MEKNKLKKVKNQASKPSSCTKTSSAATSVKNSIMKSTSQPRRLPANTKTLGSQIPTSTRSPSQPRRPPANTKPLGSKIPTSTRSPRSVPFTIWPGSPQHNGKRIDPAKKPSVGQCQAGDMKSYIDRVSYSTIGNSSPVELKYGLLSKKNIVMPPKPQYAQRVKLSTSPRRNMVNNRNCKFDPKTVKGRLKVPPGAVKAQKTPKQNLSLSEILHLDIKPRRRGSLSPMYHQCPYKFLSISMPKTSMKTAQTKLDSTVPNKPEKNKSKLDCFVPVRPVTAIKV